MHNEQGAGFCWIPQDSVQLPNIKQKKVSYLQGHCLLVQSWENYLGFLRLCFPSYKMKILVSKLHRGVSKRK